MDFQTIPELRDMHPLGVLEIALNRLQRERLPGPSLAIASGRGLYLFWLHTPIPRRALPRWNACQKWIWGALKSVGADRGALDAARVLRVPGTRNSKNGLFVETISGTGELWDFDLLAREILPHDRDEYRSKMAKVENLRSARAARMLSKRFGGPVEGYGAETLNATRLDDYQKLRELRWFGEPLPDFRDRWLFLCGNSMSYLAPFEKFQRELYALAREAGGWSEGHTRQKMSEVFRRTRAALRGERVFYNWEWRDPRYWHNSETIIEMLEITDEEQAHMVTLITDEERSRRDTERRRRNRRKAGVKDRFEIAAQNREEVREMSALGISTREIAKRLNLSQDRIKQIRRELRERGGVVSVPVSTAGVASVLEEDTSTQNVEVVEAPRIKSEAEVFELARRYFGLTPRKEEPEGESLSEELSLLG